MYKPLFKNFLTNPSVYVLNENYWKREIDKLLKNKIEYKQLYKLTFCDGTPFRNGNPIYSKIYPSLKKSLRINQYDNDDIDIDDETTFLSVLIESRDDMFYYEPDDTSLYKIPELVIDLYLTKETKNTALNLIDNWLLKDKSIEEMNILCECYQ